MIRLLADPPADYRVDQITAPGVVGVNVVDGQIAGYWLSNPPTQAEWEAIVAAHVPQPDPPSAEERIAELEAVIAALLGD